MDRKRSSITNKITLNSVLFSLVIISIIGIVAFSQWNNSIQGYIKDIEDGVAREVTQSIDDFVKIPMTINSGNYHLIEEGIIDVYDEVERNAFF